MGLTMTQKILAAHAGLDTVVPGQLIRADLDMVLANDITGPVAINAFEDAGFQCMAVQYPDISYIAVIYLRSISIYLCNFFYLILYIFFNFSCDYRRM